MKIKETIVATGLALSVTAAANAEESEAVEIELPETESLSEDFSTDFDDAFDSLQDLLKGLGRLGIDKIAADGSICA